MLQKDKIKRELARYVLLVLIIMLATTRVKSFIAPYLTWLPFSQSLIIEFLSILIILIITDLILKKILDL